MKRPRAATRVAIAIVLGAPLGAGVARAEPEAPSVPAECEGRHSLVNPVPSSCLADIDTDRPHKTDTPHALAPGHFQVELGILEVELERLSGPTNPSLVLMNNNYKVGLVDRVDLEVLVAVGSYAARTRRFRLENQALLRSKLNVLGGAGAPFSLSLVPAVVAPLARGVSVEGGGFVFLAADLPASIEAELNIGGLSETPRDARRSFAPVVTGALTRRLAGPLSVFVELYSISSTRDLAAWTTTFDSGLLLVLARDIQLDAGTYLGLWGEAPRLTPFLGLSARL